jgi:hypothetical protein
MKRSGGISIAVGRAYRLISSRVCGLYIYIYNHYILCRQVGAAGALSGEELTYCYGTERGPVGLITGYGFRPAGDV